MPSTHRIAVLCALWLNATPALADNDPEHAERDVQAEWVPKVNDLCDADLTVTYDSASLREHNFDIEHEQTDGSQECDEPLRLLWYACQTPGGKQAVRAAGIKRIVCKGTSGKTGSLTLANGTITVERAFEEERAYDRARKRFESLLGVTLEFGRNGAKDPYQDQDWRELRYAVNPTRSSSDYCLVNRKKQELEPRLVHRFNGQDAKLECWEHGEKIIDLEFRAGRKTGFYTQISRDDRQIFSYKDDKYDGEQKSYRKGVLERIELKEAGDIIWSKEFYRSGKLKEYSRRKPHHAGFMQGEDGKLYRLSCNPNIGDDRELRTLCGFEEELVVRIYDGTEKVSRIETWKNGVLRKTAAGDSDYADRSNVEYAAGKKHGVEKVLGRDGKLESTITWNNGIKDGKETVYAEGGTKVVKEIVWSASEIKQSTEFYLNGSPKLKAIYVDQQKQLRTYWDTGKLARDGNMVQCARYGGRDWCEDGLHRSYFQNGTREAEATFKLGQRHGPSRSWWPNGRQATQEEYVEGRRTKGTRWDQSGKLSSNVEYEADGSRKLAR